MGITLRRQIGDERWRSPPVSRAFKPCCEDDFSRMDAFAPTAPAQTGEEQIAGWLDRGHFGIVFNRQLENVAVPVEIVSPHLGGKLLGCDPMLGDRNLLHTRNEV